MPTVLRLGLYRFYSPKELRKLHTIVEEHQQVLLEAWYERHGN